MIAPLIAGLLVTAPPVHDVAYIARYYYPYPDKRISRDEVYVSDIRGKNRLQISHGKGEISGVRWVSETVVGWNETKNGKAQGYHFDIRNRRLKAAKAFSQAIGYENGYLSRSDSLAKPAAFRLGQEGAFELASEPLIAYPQPAEGGDEVSIVRGEKTHRWKLVNGVFHFYKSQLSGQTWIVNGQEAVSAGSSLSLYRANWKENSVSLIAGSGTNFQLASDENAWCAFQDGRPMEKYGPDKWVWTCQLRAGKIGGKEWLVTSGLVLTKEYRLRPKLNAADF